MTRRETYLSLIEPIVDRVLAICEANDIPSILVFQLDDDRPNLRADIAVVCTTTASMSDRILAAFRQLGVFPVIDETDGPRYIDREAVYDEHVYPLMGEVIGLCKAHDIPLLATFQYDDRSADDNASFVTTFDPTSNCAPCIKIAGSLIVNGYAAYTVTKRPRG